MKADHIVVNINIQGRDYPVRCTPAEAEELQSVEKELNEQLNKYRLKYAQLDKQDCLSMALIENQMNVLQSNKDDMRNQCITKLDNIETLILNHLP